MKSKIVAYAKIVGVSTIMLFAFVGGSKVYAQQLDSELVQIASAGSISLGGFRMVRHHEHIEQDGIPVTFDSTYDDTVTFSCGAFWVPPGGATLKFPNLQINQQIIGTTAGYQGFGCTIDTVHNLLLSVSCVYHDENTNAYSTTIHHRGFTIDSVPYLLINHRLTATLNGSFVLSHLPSLSAYDYYAYVGGGLSGTITSLYGPIVDSLNATYFAIILDGGITKGVSPQSISELRTRVFPNPCTDQLNVTIPGGQRSSLRIYDMLGRVWKEATISAPGIQTLNIDTRALPNGRYILTTSRASIPFSVVR